MRTRSFITVVVVLAALFTGAGALYVYDNNRDDLVSDGVSVGGIDIGGMRAPEAQRAVRGSLESRYSQPIVASFEGKRYTLTPKQAGITYDVKGAIDEALQRSRDGSIFGRTWRAATGGKLGAQIDPHVRFSRAAVNRYLVNIHHEVERKAKDATLDFSGATPEPRKGKEGIRMDSAGLRRDVEQMVLGQAPVRTLQIQANKFKPKITLAKLSQRYPELVIVNRGSFKLNFYKDLKLTKTYPIAVGQQGLETPAGLYNIQNKQVDPAWHVPNSAWAGSLAGQVIPGGTPQNPLKARWMGIFNGAGIHGTDSIGSLGSAASHGCVRMAIPDVIDLYDRVAVGTPVYVA